MVIENQGEQNTKRIDTGPVVGSAEGLEARQIQKDATQGEDVRA